MIKLAYIGILTDNTSWVICAKGCNKRQRNAEITPGHFSVRGCCKLELFSSS